MRSKDKVRLARKNGKSLFCKRFAHPFALGNDDRVPFVVIGLVRDRRRADGLTNAVHGVGIKTVLHAFQSVNERGVGNGVAAAHARQGIALGKGLDDDEIGVFFDRAIPPTG